MLLLLQQLVNRGVPAEIICLFADHNEYEVESSLCPYVRSLSSNTYPQALLRLFRYLSARRRGRLFSLMPQANIAAVCIGKLLGMRVVTSERTTPSSFYSSRVKLTLALMPHVFSNRTIFISHHALNRGLPGNWQGRAVARNSVVLHNPITVAVDSRQAATSRASRIKRLSNFLGSNEVGPLRVLIASRLVHGKGILEFLERVSWFVRKAAIHIDIAGAGPLDESIRRAVSDMCMDGKVSLLGFVSDIHSLYALSDVVMLTSESEGFGRVGFEAYQSGCLVIGTSNNSFWDEVVDAAPAWVKVDTYLSLELGLRQLLTKPIPFDGSDIEKMRVALSAETHTDNFLSCIDIASSNLSGAREQ